MDWPDWSSPADNGALPPADPAAIDAVGAAFPLPGQLREFYGYAGQVWLPDIQNGYYIHDPAMVLANAQGGLPLRVQCLDPAASGPILCFGGDGGGANFAMRTDHRTEVLFLSASEIRDSIWIESSSPRMRVLAPDFDQFLQLLLRDVAAFVSNKSGWSYFTDWTWTPAAA
jgi:hypothetical protein